MTPGATGLKMEINAALSTANDPREAAAELVHAVDCVAPDLAVLWISPHYGPEFDETVTAVRDAINPRNLIGCGVEGVIGPDREIENAPAAALWVAKLPGVRVMPFLLDQNDLSTLRESADWCDRIGVSPDVKPAFIILPDPFTIRFDTCIQRLDDAYPGSTVAGGVASAAQEPGENRLFLNDQILRQGMVGVSLAGDIGVTALVSQGCRPVGSRYIVTKADANIICELGGRNTFAVLRELYQQCDQRDQELMQQGLHIGRVVDERLETFGPGGFLIRNVAGAVEHKGIAVTDHFRAGQSIQFHIRDAESAHAEMQSMLVDKCSTLSASPRGGLVFNCNGRGSKLFTEPNHDIQLINEAIPDCPVAGFFAAGEIGPIGGRTFVHGYTSSLILFHEPCD